jgi:4-aminobutyrate aminotransferase
MKDLPGLDGIAPGAAALYRRELEVMAGIEKLRFFPLALESGSGSTLVEVGGRELIDLTATWTAAGLGHGHPKIVEAMCRAAVAPPGAGGLSAVHPESVGLAEELLALVPGTGERRVYLGHSGSDACDVAFRAVRFNSGKRKIVAFHHSYHGGIGLAMAASGVHINAGAVTPDPETVFVDYPNPYRPPADGTDPLVHTLSQIQTAFAAGDVACIMVEPMLADGGMVVPPPGLLTGIAALCRTYDVLFAVDEVKVGLGRPGLLHAFLLEDVVPDIVCFGKVIGNGLPLSATVGPAHIMDGPASAALLTTAGNPVCAAVGRAVLKTLVEEDLPARAARAGTRLRAAFEGLDSPHIGDVRGHGLANGIELVTDRDSKTPNSMLAAAVAYRAFELGVVVYKVGGNVLEVTPPLVITDDEIDRAVAIVGQAIDDAVAGKVPADVLAAYAGW